MSVKQAVEGVARKTEVLGKNPPQFRFVNYKYYKN
jgi:hypothetical protein